jgi:hypothetical protein
MIPTGEFAVALRASFNEARSQKQSPSLKVKNSWHLIQGLSDLG